MSGKTSPFLERLDAVAAETESLLDRLLTAAPVRGELARPARLIEAMRYASLGGGKRFRPFLVVESANLFGVPRSNALMAGGALECIHCYSLAHDDLPAMDNDELRRGQPTAHRKFDEATAILAGDGLFTFAFDVLSREEATPLWSANRPARTPPPGKPHLQACSALPAPKSGSASLSLKPKTRWRRSDPRGRHWSRARILSPSGRRDQRLYRRDTKAIGPGVEK